MPDRRARRMRVYTRPTLQTDAEEGSARVTASTPPTPTASARGRDAPFGALELYRGLKAGGIDFAVYLPDSTLPPVERLLRDDPDVQTVQCAREDEGIAIAAGAYLAGKLPVALMESSGIGYAALILARAQVQRTPILIVASRNRVLDEPYDYHAASRMVGEGVLGGLNIPFLVADDPRRLATLVEKAAITVRGQRSCVGLLVPNFVVNEEPE
jgi:sulfopyruvate decarboxylase subunit alpha